MPILERFVSGLAHQDDEERDTTRVYTEGDGDPRGQGGQLSPARPRGKQRKEGDRETEEKEHGADARTPLEDGQQPARGCDIHIARHGLAAENTREPRRRGGRGGGRIPTERSEERRVGKECRS